MIVANRDEVDILILDEISRFIGNSGPLAKVFPGIMGILARQLDFQRGLLVLRSADGRLRIAAAFGVPPEEVERVGAVLDRGLTGRVASSGSPVFYNDISQATEFPDALPPIPGDRPTALHALPILQEGKVVGVLRAEKFYHGERALARERRLLAIIATSVAQAIRIQDLISREKEELVQENFALREELRSHYTFDNIIGSSGKMREVMDTISRVAKSKASVLLTGETGTGKELMAHTIHYTSSRSNRPFIRVNCGALSEGLLESELFGHVRGAFTGAYRDKKGRLEMAEGGTLFLDEVGDMSPNLQVKILRVLQEREFERVGDAIPMRVDCRVIAATNRDLEEEVRKGRFREDLFFRLNVIPIHVPPLRERSEDIPVLLEFFLEKFNRENCKCVTVVPDDVLRTLTEYRWPGNVREFENVIERAVVMARGEEVRLDFLPFSARHKAEAPPVRVNGEALKELARRILDEPAQDGGPRPYHRFVEMAERHLFEEILGRVGGVQKEAARLLGINRNTLHEKLKELGLSARSRDPDEKPADSKPQMPQMPQITGANSTG